MVNFTTLFILGCAGYAGNEVFKALRSKRYKELTGRSYGRDHSQFNKSYLELVDFYRRAEPHRLDTRRFAKRKWRDTRGFVFGYDGKRLISIPSASESNIAVFGPPGTGKTSGIAIPNAMNFDGSVLAIDIKGDIYQYVRDHTDREILRFCPDDPEALTESCRFNPLEGIQEMDLTERKIFFHEMAYILIPESSQGAEDYFSRTARAFFQGIAHLLYAEEPDLTFPTIIHSVLTHSYADWIKKAVEGDCLEAKECLASFKGNSEKNVAGAYDNLSKALQPFSSPILDELLGGKGISIRELEEGKDIYLQISQEHLNSYAPLFTMMIQSFSRAFMRRPDSSTGQKVRPFLMLLDEFPALTYSYDMISSNLSTLRSKSIVIVLIQQNYAQLEQRYKEVGARALVGNCNYQVILGSNDAKSSRMFSELFGRKRVLKATQSISTREGGRKTVQEVEEDVFSPADFGDLQNNKEAIINFKGKYCKVKKLNCYAA